jgi:site-specific recombinase XerD
MLLDTGVRWTGLVNLDLADLNLDVQRLRVLHGNGNKQRVVQFGARAKEVSGMWPATLAGLPPKLVPGIMTVLR